MRMSLREVSRAGVALQTSAAPQSHSRHDRRIESRCGKIRASRVSKLDLIAAFAACLLALALSLAIATAADLPCSSSAGGYNYCRAKTQGAVELVFQQARYACYRDDTWGFDENGVWVSNGCSATFRTGEQAKHALTKDAESNELAALALRLLSEPAPRSNRGGNLQTLLAQPSASKAEATRQSDDALIDGPLPPDSYPSRDNNLDPSNGGFGRARYIACESLNERYTRCETRVPSYVQLSRLLSREHGRCRFNQSWGYDAAGIWVDKGCRAQFAVY